MRATPLLKVAPLVADRVQEFDGVRPYLATGDVGDEADIRPASVTYTDRPSRADLTVRLGDVCFARMAATRKVFEITADHRDVILSTGFAVLRPDTSKVHPGYVRHWLGTDQFQASKDRLSSGATQKAITNEKMSLLTIPLPESADEQVRIAEILDAADALRSKRRAALTQLDTLTQSIFLDMFGDPATNPKGWVQKSVGRIGTVTTGNTPPRDNPRNYGHAIEWIKSDNLNTGGYYATRASEELSEVGMACARIAPAGAILVTCIAGSPGSIGNAAMVDRPVAFNQQINALVPAAGNPHFFFAQIKVGKRLIQEASTGGMKGLVSKGRFEKILLMEPPPDLQDRFSELALRIEAMRSGHHRSLAQMEALFTALQDRAFRGEL